MTASGQPGPWTVWLASYPKSGNTWARTVLHALAPPDGHGQPGDRPGGDSAGGGSGGDGPAGGSDDDGPGGGSGDDGPAGGSGDGPGGGWGSGRRTGRPAVDINELGGGPIAACRAAIDARLGFASSDLLPDEIAALRPACDAALDEELDQLRFRKIHDMLHSGAGGGPIVPVAGTRAAIYLVRDPRDVAVSLAHHQGGPIGRAVDRMADPGMTLAGTGRDLNDQVRQVLGTWSQHVESWTRQDLFPVEIFRYEDLRADPVGGFERMAHFAGLAVSRDAVSTAVAAAAFERLREQEDRNGFRERPRVSARFFRRGVAGGWRDELPAHLVRRIEADHRASMARLGYAVGEGGNDGGADGRAAAG